MFDRYYRNETTGPSRVDVHEHRAPTADSARMLAELEKAARDKIVGAIRLENCPVDGVLFIDAPDYLNCQRELVMHLQIGGKRVEARRRFPAHAREDEIATGMLEEVSRVIAAEFLIPAFAVLQRQVGRLL